MKILAVDPGPTPGIATVRTDYLPDFYACIAPSWMDGCHTMQAMMPTLDVLVIESFTISGARGKASNETIEMIGVARWLAAQHGVEFIEQKPADVATLITRKKLREIGWDIPGTADHARSAASHLLFYLIKSRQVDVRQLV